MSTTAHSLVTQPVDMAATDAARHQEAGQDSKSRVNGSAVTPKSTKFRSKYKHVEAAHRTSRPSVLSHDSKEVPSFLGFRNLMVLTISEYSRLDASSWANPNSCDEPPSCRRECSQVWPSHYAQVEHQKYRPSHWSVSLRSHTLSSLCRIYHRKSRYGTC